MNEKMKEILLVYALLISMCVVLALPPGKMRCRKAPPRINFSVKKDNVIDLTYVFNEESAVWPSFADGFQLIELVKGFILSPTRFFLYSNWFSQPEHLGTHLDAPIHFSETGNDASEVSLNSLIGPGVLLNLKEDNKKFGEDSLVTIDHFLAWEASKGRRIRSGSIILLYTGYGEDYYNRPEYFGTNLTGPNAVPHLRFPGLDPDAASWLVKSRCIAAIGIDTASIDQGQSKDFKSHQILAGNNIPVFENVANLNQVAQAGKGFKVIALPQKIAKGSGGPLRIIAVTN